MESSILTAVVLPLALAFIMIGIGLELKRSDFELLFKEPKAIFLGLSAQMLVLPILGIIIGFYTFTYSSPLIGAGFIILALSPGGVTSNLFSLLAKADLALSVSLTLFVSLITPFWLPIAASFILSSLESDTEIKLDIGKTIIDLFVITIVPVLVGMLIHYKNESFAKKLQKPLKIFSTFFLFIIIISIANKYSHIISENYSTVLPASTILAVLAFITGYFISKMNSLPMKQMKSISIEVGIQNGTLALYVSATILGIPEMTFAVMLYSLVMFPIGFAALWLFKKVEKG